MTLDFKPVNLTWMPSKGIPYPDNIEVSVAPLSITERKCLEGATQADYYRKLLKGINIAGGPFKKEDLIFADVQFLDLVRRIYTFETDKKIIIEGYPCMHCHKENVKAKFKFDDIEFGDLPEDAFFRKENKINEETGEAEEKVLRGKIYTFSDGLKAAVYPLTVGDYIDMATRYLSNISEDNLSEQVSILYAAQFS